MDINIFFVKIIYLEVRGVSELPVAVRAGEPGLVGVGHQVVVEAVLPGEGCPAQPALEWPQPRVTPVLRYLVSSCNCVRFEIFQRNYCIEAVRHYAKQALYLLGFFARWNV